MRTHTELSRYKVYVAALYAVALFLDRLDLTIVNITLPTVAKYFHVPIVATDWISIAFLLALAISIPISQWLGTRFGFKKIYVIAIFLFGIGSTLCALAPTLDTLVMLRFIQGIGGGLLIPVGMTLLYRLYDKSEYANITSFTFLPSLIAPALAPLLGAILLELVNWQLVFLFSGPLSLLLAAAAWLLLREEYEHTITPLDWQGFLLSALILIDLFYTLSQIDQSGFSSIVLMGTIALIPLIAGFIWCERHHIAPLIPLAYFRHSLFVKTNLIQLCFQICHFGAIFLVGMFLQVGAGFSAIFAGLMMGMQAVGAIITSRYSVKLFNHYGAKVPITIGLLGIAILSPCIMLLTTPHGFIAGLILFLIRGLFSGLCGTPIQTLSVIGFAKTEIGAANLIFNTGRQISISLGVAISSLLISFGFYSAGLTSSAAIPSHLVLHVFGFGFWAISLIALMGVALTQTLHTQAPTSL